MTRTIILKGRMGELFGEVHRLNVNTVQEAMHAIDTMKGGLRQYLMDCTENGIEFTVQKGEEYLGYENIGLELNEDDIIISPVPQGAGLSDIIKTVIGIVLIIVAVTVGFDPITIGKLTLDVNAALFTIGAMLALQGMIGS